MIHLNKLPPERKKKAREWMEENWPEMVDELIELRKAFGDVQVGFEMRKDIDD